MCFHVLILIRLKEKQKKISGDVKSPKEANGLLLQGIPRAHASSSNLLKLQRGRGDVLRRALGLHLSFLRLTSSVHCLLIVSSTVSLSTWGTKQI